MLNRILYTFILSLQTITLLQAQDSIPNSEKEGIIIEGRVMDLKTKQPFEKAEVYLSIPDLVPGFEYYITGPDGRFFFQLKKYIGKIPYVIQCFDKKINWPLKITVDNPEGAIDASLPFETRTLPAELLNTIKRNNEVVNFQKEQTITLLQAQDSIPKNWNSEKIRGSRYYPIEVHLGSPFLSDNFVKGEIEFVDGIKIGDLQLRYSEYRDEIIYFNTAISAQIIIDKASLRGFSLTDDKGVKRVFRRQLFNGNSPGYRFIEILDDGEISLLVWRRVNLEIHNSNNDFNRKDILTYDKAYRYYLYHPKKGYEIIRLSKSSLLSKFNKSNQKLAKKILRKDKVRITNEATFVKAWKLLKSNRIEVIFNGQ